MSAVGTLADGRLALARNNIGLALSDLGAVRARVAESGSASFKPSNCDDEWDGYIGKVFSEQERLLREALQALS